jgi:hypothetical protein
VIEEVVHQRLKEGGVTRVEIARLNLINHFLQLRILFIVLPRLVAEKKETTSSIHRCKTTRHVG